MSDAPAATASILSPKKTGKMLDRFRVTSGDDFRLKAFPTGQAAPDFIDKARADDLLADGVRRLAALQETLYASGTWSLLVILQAMDAAGKDGTIKHVMSGVNPQGVVVTPFRVPGTDELAHDFLWRASRVLPARGMIGIFNRSYYEEVLVARVHPELLDKQHLPPEITAGKKFWDHRLSDIAAFEKHLAREGTRVVKFFLDIGRDEQKKRFLSRLDHSDKTWKFDPADIRERAHWDDYMAAYQAAIAATATETAPWFIVPADQKWFMRVVVVEAIVAALSDLDLKSPVPTPEREAAFGDARRSLEQEG